MRIPCMRTIAKWTLLVALRWRSPVVRAPRARGSRRCLGGDGVAPSMAPLPLRHVRLTPRTRRAADDASSGSTCEDGRRSTAGGTCAAATYLPAVASDGSAGGLSADGGTLVLADLPRRVSRRTAGPAGSRSSTPGSSSRASASRRRAAPTPRGHPHLSLRGAYGFDAISPDGSTRLPDPPAPSTRRPAVG